MNKNKTKRLVWLGIDAVTAGCVWSRKQEFQKNQCLVCWEFTLLKTDYSHNITLPATLPCMNVRTVGCVLSVFPGQRRRPRLFDSPSHLRPVSISSFYCYYFSPTLPVSTIVLMVATIPATILDFRSSVRREERKVL